MRTLAMAALAAAAMMMIEPANAADLDKGWGTSEVKAADKGSGRCAAIAFSSEPDKPDGWGAESYKDTCEGAASSAKAYCEENLRKVGFPNGKCNNVMVSRAWVVGVVCHVPGGRFVQGLGKGRTPADAIQAALQELGDAPGHRCGTTLIRSADHKWREFYQTTWTVHLSCGERVTAPSHLKGFSALTRAVLSCNEERVSSCRVQQASFGGFDKAARKDRW